jgi:hypothetical protein
MGQRNLVFTGWQKSGHLIDEPTSDVTITERLRNAMVHDELSDVARYGALGMPAPTKAKYEAQALRELSPAFEALVLEVAHGFAMDLNAILHDAAFLGYASAGVAHLLELAEYHREALRGYDRIYGLGSRYTDETGRTVVPYLGVVLHHSGGMPDLTLREQALFPGMRNFSGNPRYAFVLLQSITRSSGLCCHQCRTVQDH